MSSVTLALFQFEEDVTDKVVIILSQDFVQPSVVSATLNTVQESFEEDKESLSFHDKLDLRQMKNAYDDSPPKAKPNSNTLKSSNAST